MGEGGGAKVDTTISNITFWILKNFSICPDEQLITTINLNLILHANSSPISDVTVT